MKYYEEHYVEYLSSAENKPLHPKINKIYDKFSEKFDDLNNIILYGPTGVGKYSQALNLIKKYSPSSLKYEKKISIELSKGDINLKISDIHFEVDMDILGCNSKSVWNEIYNLVIDIINSKASRQGIILCKNFNNIHNELLDVFYSYMQDNYFIKYILISNAVSFIPDMILNKCEIINIPTFTKTLCKKYIDKDYNNNSINIKYIKGKTNELDNVYLPLCNNILEYINNYNEKDLKKFRDVLYDLLIYNINICDTIWYILMKLISTKKIKNKDIPNILVKTYTFLQLYNNNYRPIYHLENYFYYLIIKIHEL